MYDNESITDVSNALIETLTEEEWQTFWRVCSKIKSRKLRVMLMLEIEAQRAYNDLEISYV